MRFRRYLPILLLAAFVGLLAAGIVLGEVPVLWRKAISICLSCVGIG